MNADAAADLLISGLVPGGEALWLEMEGCTLRVSSNSASLVEYLGRYFEPVRVAPAVPDLEVVAIERVPPDPGVPFRDWAREPGKNGRKDAIAGLSDGRLIRKIRTGMLFLQSAEWRVAAGPCLKNTSQVINFINAQYMNWLQQRGWLICHAAGVVHQDQCLGIAGFSGGGKSTLMLRLIDHERVRFLTNDRMFVRKANRQVLSLGVPKLPRVNPGTIVHNERLHSLIPGPEREVLLALPSEDLWRIEEKYDVPIPALYGPGKIVSAATLGALVVLNWTLQSGEPMGIRRIDLRSRRDLLLAIMKSPGPFYQYPDGSFQQDSQPFDEEAYLQVLDGIAVYEITGRVDFDNLKNHCLSRIIG
ncbi:MAG: HprK-related kinase B [Gammaproteobacteria bacterium]|nr:HprK-related kinase B [Gammaproteobacteria bacterium]